MATSNELVGWNLWSFASLFGGAMAFIGNVLTTAVFWRRRAALRRASYLLINLAIADLLVGVSATVFSVHYTVAHYNETAEFVFELLISFFAGASICSLTIIAVERAFAITKPLKHRVVPTAFYYRAIAFIWAMATVMTGLLMVSLHADFGEVIFALFTFCAACLLTIFLSYFAIWLSSKRRVQEDIHAQERNKKLATNLLIVTVVSLAVWVPIQVLIMVSHEDTFAAIDNKFVLFVMFEVVNSLVNPFVYTLRMPEFRRELKRLCFRGRCDHGRFDVIGA